MTYSPFEVSHELDIPESSLRRIARQFEEFLSPQKTKRRRYTRGDIETLRIARELLDKGSTVEQVHQELARIVDVQPPPIDSTALAPIDRRLAQLDESYQSIAARLDQISQDRQEDRERFQRLQDWLRLPWYKRLFRKPPE